MSTSGGSLMGSGTDAQDKLTSMFRSHSFRKVNTSPMPPPRAKIKSMKLSHTDSDASNVDSDVSGGGGAESDHKTVKKRAQRRKGSEWEIIEGLKDGQRFDSKPAKYTGYLHKKRKWPLKGWHKRYFVLDNGILIYAKSPADVARGKLHGSVDIALSVISTKEKRRRVDIDAEEFIYHLKAKTPEIFHAWIAQFKAHRLYRQHLLTYGMKDVIGVIKASQIDDVDGYSNGKVLPLASPTNPRDSLPRKDTNGRMTDSEHSLDSCAIKLTQIQQQIERLTACFDALDVAVTNDAWKSSSSVEIEQNLLDSPSPNVKKDRKKFTLRKKKSSKGGSCDLTGLDVKDPARDSGFQFPTCVTQTAVNASNQSLNTVGVAAAPRPHSLPSNGDNQLAAITDNRRMLVTPDRNVEIGVLKKDILQLLKSTTQTLNDERERLLTIVRAESSPTARSQTYRGYLNQVLQQNQELRARLAKIHETADVSDLAMVNTATPDVLNRQFNASFSYSSSCISTSEYFDAEDTTVIEGAASPTFVLTERADDTIAQEIGDASDLQVVVQADGSETSSEGGSLTSEEGSVASSGNSEVGSEYNALHASISERESSPVRCITGRRTRLPAARPNTEGLSLWNLLCKNIGKDLSQISMPVALNEPLNMLQRLCEELEYSELLDKAADLDDPYERMVNVAAFAVSSYGSSYFRAGNKPFNPLLGETYECIREDKGFRFVSEQVSHHPPVSACQAESKNYLFWQDARIKTKFWGKSMEFQPLGVANIRFPKRGDHYQYNKVTTCVHNLFSGQRWVDQYGELKITNVPLNITCRLTFVKASYWSAKRHEVHGTITNDDGKVVRKLFGKWSDALYCGEVPSARCIWRLCTMPPDYELYYGFTRFAIELNELGADAALLPCTDTRFRPDQRALEKGDLEMAEALKLKLEQAQRERRKRYEVDGVTFEPRWFGRRESRGEEVWECNDKYWDVRKSPGFQALDIEPLW